MKRIYQFYDKTGERLVAERPYCSLRSALRYAAAHSLICGSSHAVNDPAPRTSDARAWDDWRARR